MLPECGAQRVVHIVAGTGGLAWFTLLWPPPALITEPKATYAYDDPTKAPFVSGATAEHPLYARSVDGHPLLQGVGTKPSVTAFVVGTNETHTPNPTSAITLASGASVIPTGAVAQKVLTPTFAVLAFAGAAYGTATGAPNPLSVADLDGAIGVMKGQVTPAEEQGLRAPSATLDGWGAGQDPLQIALAQKLFFTAHAFELGLLGTIIIPAVANDPHGAFATVGPATTMADGLARMVEGFYLELATMKEPRCGHNGAPLSLADNVVLIVSGDTPKDSFNSNGWPDGTTANYNLLYVRSNGWLTPGWFGQVSPLGKADFSPTTGQQVSPSTPASSASARNGALGGVLHAISRGNAAFVNLSGVGACQGVLAPTAP